MIHAEDPRWSCPDCRRARGVRLRMATSIFCLAHGRELIVFANALREALRLEPLYVLQKDRADG